MNTKLEQLKQAVGEAGEFLEAFAGLEAGTDVRQLTGCPWPPLSVGTVYVLHELARDIAQICEEYPAELARVLPGS